jgi:hypothetical protein
VIKGGTAVKTWILPVALTLVSIGQARSDDGSIVAWGFNENGQCDVPAENADFVSVAGGRSHSLGLKSDGTIVAWGYNHYGQCNVPSPNAGFMAIGGCAYHGLGVRDVQWNSSAGDRLPYPAWSADRLYIRSVTPNPIATSAEILFEAGEFGCVKMAVHDVGGRQITTEVLGSFGPGRHRIQWDARDAAGGRLTSMRQKSGGIRERRCDPCEDLHGHVVPREA